MIASALVCSALATAATAGDVGPRGPIPRPSLRTIFSTLCASDTMYLSQSTFPNPRRPRPIPSLAVQGGERPFRDGPTPETFPLVRGGPVALPGSQVLWVTHREADVAALLSRRETGILDWASLTIFLQGYILVGAVPPVEGATAQGFALRADQVRREKRRRLWRPCWFPGWDEWGCRR